MYRDSSGRGRRAASPRRWRARPNRAAFSPGRSPEPRRPAAMQHPAPASASGPRQDTIDELFYGRHEAVRIEWIALEAERRMAGEHEIFLDRPAMGDFLKRLLDAEAPRIGQPPRRLRLITPS